MSDPFFGNIFYVLILHIGRTEVHQNAIKIFDENNKLIRMYGLGDPEISKYYSQLINQLIK